MFFLKKLFQLRDHTNPSAEKPFLEHLEDLRVCITRIVLALLISTVVCFIFRNELMDIMRRPVSQVWEQGQEEALEDSKISVEDWEKAKHITESYSALLLPEDRAQYLAQFDDPDEVLGSIRMVSLYRAARTFEEKEEQEAFIETNEALDAALKEKLLALIEGEPNPKSDARGKLVLMQALKPTEGFMLSIKLAFFAGIVVSFPFLLYFLLQFVLPGMHATERRALWPAMLIGFGLFLSGVFFSYFIVLPKVLEFFHEYSAEMKIENEWRIGYYISFATQFTLIFGLSFELPVLVMTLVKLGILNCEMMRRTRAYAILAIFVIAAIITPTPDAFTLCLLAGPMVVLYEICIWLAYFMDKKAARREAEEEKERMARLLELKKRREELGEDDDPDPDPDDDDHGFDHDHDHDPDDDGTGPGGSAAHADHDDAHDSGHDPYHDEHGYGHDHGHDQDPHDEHYHTDDESFRADHDAEHDLSEGQLGHGDDGHTGEEKPSEPASESKESKPDKSTDASASTNEQQGFNFHEEVDPALTEEGEEEDISDPWPEEGEASESDEKEDEFVDPHNPPEDIPDEERYRDREDPNNRDRD